MIVDQFTVLFSRTIRDNVTYGLEADATDAEVEHACREAQAWEFIEDKPDKLLAMVASGGSNLSGGQRQRLAIARAMIRRPDVILLDEATSALDSENEAKVQVALDALARRGSALIIAHRLSTIKDADKILLVHEGRVAEEGSHDELLAKEPRKRAEWVLVPPSADADAAASAAAAAKEEEPATPTTVDGAAEEEGRLRTPHRQATAPAVLEPERTASASSDDEGPSYRRLWETANGTAEKTTLAEMASRIEQLQAELGKYQDKYATMNARKLALLSPAAANS